MPRLQPRFQVKPVAQRGFVELSGPAREKYVAAIKKWPGHSTRGPNSWLVDAAFPSWFAAQFPEVDVSLGNYYAQMTEKMTVVHDMNQTLRTYQQGAAAEALYHQTWCLHFEMGLGKTATAIEAWRLANVTNGVIVCPANVRETWAKELNRWWPDHPKVVIQYTGKTKLDAPIVITSYELVGKLEHSNLDGLIYDEFHYCSNLGARRSKVIRAFTQRNRQALILALTATPIANEIFNIWAQLNILWPGRFGDYWQFCGRYCHIDELPFGISVRGINEDNAAELEHRLRFCATRVTKAAVADQIPPLTVKSWKILQDKKSLNFREFIDRFTETTRLHSEALDNECLRLGTEKVDAVAERVEEQLKFKPRIAVITYYRATADELHKKLQNYVMRERLNIDVLHVDGSLPTKKRNKVLDAGREKTSSILVATMTSVSLGIDLSHWDYAIIAELYWKPSTVSQVIARFGRTQPGTVELALKEGSLDEGIASKILGRIRAAQAVQEGGFVDDKMTAVLAEEDLSDEELMLQLRDVALGRIEEDPYL